MYSETKLSSGGSKGGAGDARPLLGVQILSISCTFWEILAKSYVGAPPPGSWRPLLGEILDPPLLSERILLLCASQKLDVLIIVAGS